VAAAREIQVRRYAGKGTRSNAEADGQLLDEVATPDPEGRKLLAAAAERFKLSARGYHRAMRVARTLADLEASAGVRRLHIGSAVIGSDRPTSPATGNGTLRRRGRRPRRSSLTLPRTCAG
jgi:predicted ATPase with chaperone activity